MVFFPFIFRKNKLFTSQPNLGIHQNLSQSLGRMMESEPASHYQLSLDETDELLVDQGMFELGNLKEYEAEPRYFGGTTKNDESIESIELSPVKLEELNDQKTLSTEIRSSSTPDIKETDQTKETINNLQPLYPSSPAILDDLHNDPPMDRVPQMMQSESRDGDLEDSETSDTHNGTDDHRKPSADSEAEGSRASNSSDHDDTAVDAQNDQLKENDESDSQSQSSTSKIDEVVSKKDSELLVKEAEESTADGKTDDTQKENPESESQSQKERSTDENTSGEEHNERTPKAEDRNEDTSEQKSDVESGKGLNDHNGEKQVDSMSDQEEKKQKVSKDSLEEYDGDQSTKSSSSAVGVHGGHSEQKQNDHSPTLSSGNVSAGSVGEKSSEKESDRGSVVEQEKKRKASKDSLEEYDGDESTNSSSSEVREHKEHSEQKQNDHSPTLSSGNASAGSVGEKSSEKESDHGSVVETSLQNVSDLTEMFQRISSSPASSPKSETKYKPLNYPSQNILQSGLDTSGSESSLEEAPLSGKIQQEEVPHEVVPLTISSGNNEHKQHISSLATVTYKAPLYSSATNNSDESETGSEVNLVTSEMQKVEPKLAEHVKTSGKGDSETTTAQQPVRKRRPTPAPIVMDQSVFQNQLLQSAAAVSALVGGSPRPRSTGKTFLGSITEEGGFKEEDEEELESENEGYTQF